MKGKLVLALVVVLLLGVTVFAGSKVVGILSEYRAGEDTYEQMEQFVVQPSVQPEKKPVKTEKIAQEESVQQVEEHSEARLTPEDAARFPVVDFAALKEINPDVVGWITIEGTQVNYPIVQGEDNDYYLKRMINGKYNSAGSIFMDYQNAADFSDDNTVLYGHNMNNGSMFADIRKYREQEYYDEHPQILLMTEQENYLYDVVAGYVVKENGAAWQREFASDEEAAEWIDKAIKRSTFKSTVQPEAGDHYLTLSTCTYEVNNARYVLVAVQHSTED